MHKPATLKGVEESKSFYDDRYSKKYMEDWTWTYRRPLRILETIRRLDLSKTGYALDFGCGNGLGTDIMKKALPSWEVYGTDISSKAISNAKSRFPQLHFFELSHEQEFYSKFDFVFSHHVLEHVFDINETFNTMNKFLKKSSSMLYILPCGNSGSLYDRIGSLVKDGIDKQTGRLFF